MNYQGIACLASALKSINSLQCLVLDFTGLLRTPHKHQVFSSDLLRIQQPNNTLKGSLANFLEQFILDTNVLVESELSRKKALSE